MNDEQTGFVKYLDIGVKFDQNFEDYNGVEGIDKDAEKTKTVELT